MYCESRDAATVLFNAVSLGLFVLILCIWESACLALFGFAAAGGVQTMLRLPSQLVPALIRSRSESCSFSASHTL